MASSPKSGDARPLGIALIAAAAVCWGTAGIGARFLGAVGDAEPEAIGFYRLAIASAVLIVLALVKLGPGAFQVQRQDWLALFVVGTAQAAYQGLYFGAVERIGVTMSTLIALCGAPVLVTLLGIAFFKEALSVRIATAIAIAMAGVVALLGFPEHQGAIDRIFWVGVLMSGGAALAYAVFALASWKIVQRYHPFVLVGIAFGIGAALLAPVALHSGMAVEGGLRAWAIIGFIALASTVIAYVLFYKGLRHARPVAAGVLAPIEPLTASLLAALLFGELLGPLRLFGAALLLVAALLLSKSRRPPPPV